MQDNDLHQELLITHTAITEAQAQLESISRALAKLARDGLDTSKVQRQLNRIEQILRRDLEVRERLSHERLSQKARANRTGPAHSN